MKYVCVFIRLPLLRLLYLSLVVRKPAFCICENKDADQLRSNTAKLISAFVFSTQIVQSLYVLNTKFEESSHFVWLYSLVCVGPGGEPLRPFFFKTRRICLHHEQTTFVSISAEQFYIGCIQYQFSCPALLPCIPIMPTFP